LEHGRAVGKLSGGGEKIQYGKNLGLRNSLLLLKTVAVLSIGLVSIVALVPGEITEALPWIALISGTTVVMAALLMFDRPSSFTILSGAIILADLLVASIIKEFDALPLWSILAIGLISIILGVSVSTQSHVASEGVYLTPKQEHLLLMEVLRSVGISLLAILGVMVLSLAVLSLTFLAELGLSSAIAMAILAVVIMLSLGALVATRERI
jgi:hypothetical protein